MTGWGKIGRLGAAFAVMFFTAALVHAADPTPRWWRGCLHAHSLWSDADVFPETAAAMYKEQGYHFLSITDHNRYQEGERWLIQKTPSKPDDPHARRGVATPQAMEAYKARFGPKWVDERTSAGKQQVRLKTWDEIRGKFDEPGRFLLLPGEEVTGRVHLNVINLRATISFPKFANTQPDLPVFLARQITQQALAQAAPGRPILVQLCHPGWLRSPLTHDEVARMDFLHVMEINNDDSGTSASIPGAEKMWDAVLAHRRAKGLPPMLVTAGDDTHEYLKPSDAPDGGFAHGWIMVRAKELTPESLIAAMRAGDFYATSGVLLREVVGSPGTELEFAL